MTRLHLFWDRDTDLLVVAFPNIAPSDTVLVVQFSDATDPLNVCTVSVLEPSNETSGYRCAAVPAKKLYFSSVRAVVSKISSDWTASNKIFEEDFTLCREEPDEQLYGEVWYNNDDTGALRITESKPTSHHRLSVGFRDAAMIDSPRNLKETPSQIESRSFGKNAVSARRRGQSIFPSSRRLDSRQSKKIAVNAEKVGPHFRLTIQPLDFVSGLSIALLFLPLNSLLAPTADDFDFSKLDVISQNVQLGAKKQYSVVIEQRFCMPLDRIIISRDRGGARSTIGALIDKVKFQFGAISSKEPTDDLEFGIVNDGRFVGIGPALAMASYGLSMVPDVNLSRRLRSLVQLSGSDSNDYVDGFLGTFPTFASYAPFASGSASYISAHSYVKHADRAVLFGRSHSKDQDLEDPRAVIGSLNEYMLNRGDGQCFDLDSSPDQLRRRESVWLDAVLAGRVPLDPIRALLLDTATSEFLRLHKPTVDLGDVGSFSRNVRLVVKQQVENAIIVSLFRWLGLKAEPLVGSKISEFVAFYSELSWEGLHDATGLEQVAHAVRRNYPHLSRILRALQLDGGNDLIIESLMLFRIADWMYRSGKLSHLNESIFRDPVLLSQVTCSALLQVLDDYRNQVIDQCTSLHPSEQSIVADRVVRFAANEVWGQLADGLSLTSRVATSAFRDALRHYILEVSE